MIDTNTKRMEPLRKGVFVRFAQGVYAVGAWLFVATIVLQVFLAGAGALVQPSYWALHSAWGQIITSFPLVMLVVGLIARVPRRMLGLTALLFVLFALQYVFLWVLPDVVGIMALRALHAVNALVLFSIALYLAQHA